MTVAQDATAGDPKRTILDNKLTIIVTLLASLIGGIFGFGGSLLVFFSSQASLKQAYSQHAEDVRRDYYTDFLSLSNKLKSSLSFSSIRAVSTGRALTIADCNVNDLFIAQEASIARVYFLGPDSVNTAAVDLNSALTDWFNSLCGSSLPYAKSTEDDKLKSVFSARDRFIDAAKEALAK